MNVSNEKELGKALKNNEDTIVVEGNLAKKVFRIKATGKVAWAVAIGGIGVAITAAIATVATGGLSAPMTGGAAVAGLTPAALALGGGGGGLAVATSAVTIGVAGGGIEALNKLRKYKLKKDGNRVILTRK